MSYSISNIYQFELSFWIYSTDLTGKAVYIFFLHFKGQKLFSNNAESTH